MPTVTLKCRGCKGRFPRDQMIKINSGNFHSYDCATSYAREKGLKQREKKQNAEFRKRKAAIKPKNTLLSEAQSAFNDWIRYRDKDKPCINTGAYVDWHGNDSDAAHYVSRGANPAMRFDLRNVHKATKQSNKNQEKWIHHYRDNLRERLGEERFKQFEEDCRYWRVHKRTFNKEYLQRVKRIFRRKKRIIMRIRGDL